MLKKKFFPRFKWVFALCLIYLCLLVTNGVPHVFSDGYCYYHIARSIVDKGSFVQYERPEYFDYRGHVIAFYQGKYTDVCSPGTSIIMAPGLFMAKQLRPAGQTIYNNYDLAYNGHTLADGISVLLTAAIVSLITLLLLYKTFRLYNATEKVSILLTGGVFLSSYAVWYVFLNASYTHTYELFFISLIIWSYKKLKLYEFKRFRYAVLMGIASGFGFLTRPLIIIPGLAYGILLLIKKKFRQALIYLISNLPFILLWMVYNYISYGNPVSSGYNEIRGENFNFALSNFHFFDVLFSPQRGWFIYSPLFFIGVIGLILAVINRRYVEESVVALVSIIFVALLYGFWPSWWGGGSYGARFLIMLAPFTIFGLLYLLKYLRFKFRKIVFILMGICVLYSVIFTIIYRFTPVAKLRPSTDSAGTMYSGDRYTPVDLAEYQINLIKESTSIPNYLNNLYKHTAGGNSLLVIPLGIQDTVFRVDDRKPDEFKIYMISPSVKKQEDAEEVLAYMQDRNNNDVYKIKFVVENEGIPYFVDYHGQNATATDNRIQIILTKNYPSKLPYDDYTGLQLENTGVNIYFHKAFNIQFKGPPVNKTPGGDEYYLLPVN